MFQWTINFCVELLMCLGCDVSTEVSDIDYALVINFILLGRSISKGGLWQISFLLVDLRDDKQFFADHPGAVPITTAQGEELRKLIGASVYIECSSKTQQNVKAVFDAAIKVVLQPPKNKKKKKRKAQKACSILWFFKTRVLWRKHDQLIIYPKSYPRCFPRLLLPRGRSRGL